MNYMNQFCFISFYYFQPLKVVNQLDLSREDISKGTIWLPIDLGGMGLQDGPYVKVPFSKILLKITFFSFAYLTPNYGCTC